MFAGGGKVQAPLPAFHYENRFRLDTVLFDIDKGE